MHFQSSFEPRFSEVDKSLFLSPPLCTTSCNVHYSGSIWQWKRDLEQVWWYTKSRKIIRNKLLWNKFHSYHKNLKPFVLFWTTGKIFHFLSMNLLGDHILAVFPPKKNVSETLFRKLSLVYQGLNKLCSKFKKLRPVCRLLY